MCGRRPFVSPLDVATDELIEIVSVFTLCSGVEELGVGLATRRAARVWVGLLNLDWSASDLVHSWCSRRLLVPDITARRSCRLCTSDEHSLNRRLVSSLLFDQLGIDYAVNVCSEANVVGSGEREVEVRLRVGVAIVYRHLGAAMVADL